MPKAPAVRPSRLSRNTNSADFDYGIRVPRALHKAIDMQRDNLSRAQSILTCMVAAMEHEGDQLISPYFPEVTQTVRELVESSIDGLDPFVLKQRLRDKVEEGFCVSLWNEMTPLLQPVGCMASSG
jgi:hypothetical protein